MRIFEEELISSFKIMEFDKGWKKIDTSAVKELYLTIYLNKEPIVTLICSNNSKESLAVGFLAMGRFIDPADVENIKIKALDEESIYVEGIVLKKAPFKQKRIITPGLGKGTIFLEEDKDITKSFKIKSSLKISPNQVFSLMKKLSNMSKIYKITHGVHNAAICTTDKILIFKFDLGRHNAVDKLYGQCLIEKIPMRDKILVSSGRVSSEIITKAARMGIPILISRSAPTDKAIDIAKKIGLTLIARVRDKKMSVYTHEKRLNLS